MKIDREDILRWMSLDCSRTVLGASVHFRCTPQEIHDILGDK